MVYFVVMRREDSSAGNYAAILIVRKARVFRGAMEKL
jgi:hypothetical protein